MGLGEPASQSGSLNEPALGRDSNQNDITYFYESQLSGETSPVADYHFHPVEPRQVRITLRESF